MCDPSNFKWVTLGGDSTRFTDQSAILEGSYPVAVPSGAGTKTVHAYFLLKAGHAQRLGAEALREMLVEGRPDHVCEGLHSEFQHVGSSGLQTSFGFGRRQSNNAKKHVYAVGRRVRPSSPALAHLDRVPQRSPYPAALAATRSLRTNRRSALGFRMNCGTRYGDGFQNT